MRLGGLKYVSPLRYMGTKIVADAIHSVLGPRRPVRVPDVCRLPNERVTSLAESRPVFDRAPGRPAAVKSNGGLRGSTATRWR